MQFDFLFRDARHSARRLLRDWRFTSAAVLILALAIGANTAIFSVINAALLRPQRFTDPDRLVDIFENARDGSGPELTSYPTSRDMAEYTDTFSNLTAVSVPVPAKYRVEGSLRSALIEYTTSTYPSVLGVRPSLGRWFDAAEDTRSGDVVGIIGHQTWTREFGADPSVIGRVIRINGVPVTIIGVGPVDYDGTVNIGIVTDFWLPVSSIVALGMPAQVLEIRAGGFLFVKARLKDGVTVEQAQAAMQALGARLSSEYPKESRGKGITVLASSELRIHPRLDSILTPIATALLAIVGLVLAIACSNLATLLLVRGSARSKEVSVRLAIGATRRQLITHLLMESLLLSIAGGTVGCLLASWAISALSTIDLPITLNFSIDYRVLTFTTVLCFATGIAFGFAPALRATKIDLLPGLRGNAPTGFSGRRWLTLRSSLVVFQVAVSVLLLAGAGLFFRILSDARSQRLGFATDGIAMIETDTRYAGYSTSQTKNVFEQLRERIASVPGVQAAALLPGGPMSSAGEGISIVVDGRATEDERAKAGSIWAGPGFFDLLQIPIIYGRAIDERDRANAPPVAVIGESMARKYFGVENAVGRRFRIAPDRGPLLEVVGVARDTGTASPFSDLVDPSTYLFFRPFEQWDVLPTTIVARTSFDATTLLSAMQRELRELNASLPVVSATTMRQQVENSLAAAKAATTFLGMLGAIGACLAGVGLYAVVAFAVARRSHEIGIRMALGAQRRQVVGSVVREVGILMGAGTGVGLALALIGMLFLRSVGLSSDTVHFYYTVKLDPVPLLLIAAFMAAVGLAAALVPARRAAGMSPLSALRHD
jgi:predicted permease